jgi:hypothetical protein
MLMQIPKQATDCPVHGQQAFAHSDDSATMDRSGVVANQPTVFTYMSAKGHNRYRRHRRGMKPIHNPYGIPAIS